MHSRRVPTPIPFAFVLVAATLGSMGPAMAGELRLGVDVQDADSGGQGLCGNGCAEIVEVMPGSPAARAALEPGDWVHSVGDEFVEDAAHLRELLAGIEPGTTVQITVLRWRTVVDRIDIAF